MTYLLVVACALLWCLVLFAARGSAREGMNDRSRSGLGRSMWALRSNHEVRRRGGRWILVPYKPLGQNRDNSALRRRNF